MLSYDFAKRKNRIVAILARAVRPYSLKGCCAPPWLCFSAVAMVVGPRVEHLRALVMLGHQVSVAYSYSVVSHKSKVKVLASSTPGLVPELHRDFSWQSMAPLMEMVGKYCVVDRGHRFSDGHCEATFWCSAVGIDVDNTAMEATTDVTVGESVPVVACSAPVRPVRVPAADGGHDAGVCPPPPPPRSCRTMDRAEVAGLRACLLPPQPPCPPPLMPNPAPCPPPLMPCPPPPPPPVSVRRRGEDEIQLAEWERLLAEETADSTVT